MLSYLLRTLPVLVRARVGMDGSLVSNITRRVRLSEIDTNRHMNQAVYAQVFELGRVDWFVRSGAWHRFTSQGVYPVVAEQRLVYRRELAPFAKYSIDSRAVGVTGRLLELQSLLIVGDRVHTQCDVKLIFIGKEGVLSPDAVEALCAGLCTDPLVVQDWRVEGHRPRS